jgi:hypothetical protein
MKVNHWKWGKNNKKKIIIEKSSNWSLKLWNEIHKKVFKQAAGREKCLRWEKKSKSKEQLKMMKLDE